MADGLTLDVTPRSAVRKANKRLRREGIVPVHVFGPGADSGPLQAQERDVRHVIQRAGTTGLIQVQVDGKSENVMVRHVQRHPVTGGLVHVDLYRVRMDQKTRVRVPLVFVGESTAVTLLDGTLLHSMEAVNIEALPGDIPHSLEVDISVLTEIDQALHVSDVVVPASIVIIDDPEELVIKVQPPRKVEEEAPAPEEAAAPTAEAGGESASEAAKPSD